MTPFPTCVREALYQLAAAKLDSILDRIPGAFEVEATLILSHKGTPDDAIVVTTHADSGDILAVLLRMETGPTEAGVVTSSEVRAPRVVEPGGVQ